MGIKREIKTRTLCDDDNNDTIPHLKQTLYLTAKTGFS